MIKKIFFLLCFCPVFLGAQELRFIYDDVQYDVLGSLIFDGQIEAVCGVVYSPDVLSETEIQQAWDEFVFETWTQWGEPIGGNNAVAGRPYFMRPALVPCTLLGDSWDVAYLEAVPVSVFFVAFTSDEDKYVVGSDFADIAFSFAIYLRNRGYRFFPALDPLKAVWLCHSVEQTAEVSNSVRGGSNIIADSVTVLKNIEAASSSTEIPGVTDVDGTNSVNTSVNASGLAVTYDASTTSTESSSGSGASVTYNNETNIEINVDVGEADMVDSVVESPVVEELYVEGFAEHDEATFVYITGVYPEYKVDWEKLQADFISALAKVVDVNTLDQVLGYAESSFIQNHAVSVVCPWGSKVTFGFVLDFRSLASYSLFIWLRVFLQFCAYFFLVYMILKLFV
ncbi:MAG: hypothetical protein Q4D38_05140 [Planctomycetia bacterium]|nr:hypothetical protein [Planctomycetia bacterium]